MKQKITSIAMIIMLTLCLGITTCAMVLVMDASVVRASDEEGQEGQGGSDESGSTPEQELPSVDYTPCSPAATSQPSAGDYSYATTASGQEISKNALYDFAAATTISGPAGAEVRMVGTNKAMTLTEAANSMVGANAVIASMVDIQVPEGTGAASFTLGVPSLIKGQSVTVLHLKGNGEIETLPVSAVGNGTVTFTMTSYSPVAVVVNATAPKTADVNVSFILLLAVSGLAAAVVCSKKSQKIR